MVEDLSHLLPSKESIEKGLLESVETSLFRQLLLRLGVPGKAVKQRLKKDGKLTSEWFGGEYEFPFIVDAIRVKNCNVQDFFERPTKTPVFDAFCRLFPDHKATPSALMFKANGFTSLVIFTSPVMGGDVSVALRFTVRGVSYFVSTLKEFGDAYRERCGTLDS